MSAPLILGTNSIKDVGYNVDNSLRFNRGSSDYLNKTFLVLEVEQHGQFLFGLKEQTNIVQTHI